VSGIVAAVLAIALVGGGALLRPEGAGTLVAVGALLGLAALAVTGPALTRPVLWLLGGSGARLGTTGRLARGNSLRTPRRTWTTAAALTIGLALVSSVAVLAASMKASVSQALDATMRADLVITSSDAMTGGGVPGVLAEQLADLPEVGAVSPARFGPGQIEGEGSGVTAIDPSTWDQVARIEVTDGSLDAFAPTGTVAVDGELAAASGYAVGDTIDASFPSTGPIELQLTTIYEPDELLSGWLVSTATHGELFAQPLDASVLITGADGVDVEAVRAAVEEVAAAFPAAAIQDQAEYRDSVASGIDRMLALVTALLGMALFIAVIGIMNTLALSIHERTREIGLLRAVGMTRTQVRRMIRWEAVTVALLGAVVGLLFGTGLGWAATRVLEESGLTAFVVPGGQLVGAVVLALLAGVAAAVLPARGAAKLDVLRAVTVE
jgi:putative ABC transport system permease protein